MKYELRALDQDGQLLARSRLRALPEKLIIRLLRGWASAAFDRIASCELVQAVTEDGKVLATITRTTDLVRRGAGTRAITARVDGRLYRRCDLDSLAAEMVGLHHPESGYDWMLQVGPSGPRLIVAVHDTCTLELVALDD